MVTVRFNCCLELMFVHSILNVNRQYQILKLNLTTSYENCECYKLNLGTTLAYIGLTYKKGWTEISAQNLAKAFTVCSTHSSLDPILRSRMIRFMYTVVICNKFQVDFRKDWIWREKPSNHLVIFPRLSQIATEKKTKKEKEKNKKRKKKGKRKSPRKAVFHSVIIGSV